MLNVRKDFPILQKQADLVYLDSAASALKPQVVLDKLTEYYTEYSTNVHRGLYPIAQKATDECEAARETIARFLNAASEEIIFTRGATESLNLVAYSFGRRQLSKGDAVVVSEIEHHSNIVPWHLVAQEREAKLVWWEMKQDGTLSLNKLKKLLERHMVKIVAVTYMSNVTATIIDIAAVTKLVHKAGAYVVVDAAQWAPHGKIDVKKTDVDFLALSGHKLYGPTGIGILYGKREHLEGMPPFLGGGEMIREVTKEKITYNDIPYKFEAGTMPIAQAIGLGAAIEYLCGIGLSQIQQHERALTEYASKALKEVPGLTILGPETGRGPLFSFTVEGIHPHDLGTLLGDMGIAVRAGHHCAMPVHRAYGIPASTRASFGVYTTTTDIDRLVSSLLRIRERFAKVRSRT